MMMPVGRLTIIRTFHKSELLMAMNFVIIPALIGPLLGPTVGGLIVHWLSWREIFFVNVPVGLMALLLVHRYMPDYHGDAPPLDLIGLLLFGTGTALLSWLLEIFGEHNIDPASVAVLFLLSIGLLVAMVGMPAKRLILCCASHCFGYVPSGFRSSAASSPGWAWVGCRFCCPCSINWVWACPPGSRALLMMPTAAAAMGMKLISAWVLRRYGYRQVLIVNTVMIRIHHQSLCAGEREHADCADRASGAGAGLFQLAAIFQHEFDGLRRYRDVRFEHEPAPSPARCNNCR